MPSYLVDEGGARTHAVIPVEEHERLVRTAEKFEAMRGYATDLLSVMDESKGATANGRSDEESQEESQEERRWMG